MIPVIHQRLSPGSGSEFGPGAMYEASLGGQKFNFYSVKLPLLRHRRFASRLS
ncbi:MAG: hypothetical protein R3F07_06995 [Opitutaceae bacterium]